MTKRSKFIAGTMMFAGAILVANGADSLFAYGHTVVRGQTISSPWIPGFGTFIALTVIWYALCWVNAIKEWNRRPVLLFGRYYKTAGPGLVLIEPLVFTTLPDVPVQDVVKQIAAPKLQTKDNVSVGISGVLTYRVDETKVRDAVVAVEKIEEAVLQRALATMNDVGSTTDLDHFLAERDKFGTTVVEKLRERVKDWGVTIKALELQAFKINDSHVEQAIAMKARAEKEASAELVRANMQKQIAVALNAAAGELNENGWKLKGMEILIELCRSANNNTIVVPSDVQSGLGSLLALARPAPGGVSPKTDESTPATKPALAA